MSVEQEKRPSSELEIARPPAVPVARASDGLTPRGVAAARAARTWAGLSGLGWIFIVILGGVLQAAVGGEGLPTLLLLLAAPVMLVAGRLGRLEVPRDEPDLDLRTIVDLQGQEESSFQWPVAAASLLGPLTLHAWLWGLLGAGSFDQWMLLSVPLTACAHAVLLHRMIASVRQKTELPVGHGALQSASAGTVASVTLAGFVPGGVLFGVPPVLVGLTALVLVPSLSRWVHKHFERERDALLSAARQYAELRPEAFDAEVDDLIAASGTSDAELLRTLELVSALRGPEGLHARVLALIERGHQRDRPYAKSLTRALQLCLERGITPPVDAAIRLARHPSSDVARQALALLARYPDKKAQEELQRVVAASEGDMQLVAMRALAAVGGRDAAAFLVELAAKDVGWHVRQAARTAVRTIHHRLGGDLERATLSIAGPEDLQGGLSSVGGNGDAETETPAVSEREPEAEAGELLASRRPGVATAR